MNKKLKKVFILGVGGKLGRALLDIFKDGYDCVGFSRYEFDITDAKKAEEIIASQKPNVVINASAYNAVDKCEDQKYFKEAMAVNAIGPGIIADICKKNGAVIVHYSSDYIFAGDSPEGYMEDAVIKPINAYGQTKWLGEDAVRKSGANFYVIRTSRLFGPPGISEHGKGGVIEQVKALDVSDFQVIKGEQACPTYSYDLARATMDLVEGGYPYGIYNITNSGACSRFEFYKAIAERLNVKTKIISVDSLTFSRAAVRPSYSILKNTKLPALRSWQEALKEMIEKFYNS